MGTNGDGGDNGYPFRVWNGLLEPPHIEQIGPAIWLFLWCIDKQTDDHEGWVLGGRAITQTEIAASLPPLSKQTIGDHQRRLEEYEYLELFRTRRGTRIRVCKPKKWKLPQEEETTPSPTLPPTEERPSQEPSFHDEWAHACDFAKTVGYPDFEELERDFFGLYGENHKKAAKKFIGLGRPTVEYALRQFGQLIEEKASANQLDMVPTNPRSVFKRLMIFARQAPQQDTPSNLNENMITQRLDLQKREKNILARREAGEDVTEELAALHREYAKLRSGGGDD